MMTSEILVDWLRADHSMNSSVALININNLSCPLEANRAYAFSSELQFSLAGIVSGFKFGIAAPASPANLLYQIEAVTSGLAIAALGLSTGIAAALALTGPHVAHISGLIENGANAGLLAIQFAQNVSNISPITILRGSWLNVWNLS